MALLFTSRLLGLLVEQMTLAQQRRAFELELHALITRFLDEFDLPAEALLDIVNSEEMFLIAMAFNAVMDEEGTPEDKAELNGDSDE